MTLLRPPEPGFNLYGIYHHHEYGGSIHLVWSDHDPSETAIVAACGMEFEPDLDEWIAIDSIIEVATISNTSVEG